MRRRRRWHATPGAIMILVIFLAIVAGVLFGRTILSALNNRPPATTDNSQTGAPPADTGGAGEQSGQTGQSGESGASGQAGSGEPAGTVAEIPFKLPALVTFNVQAGRFDSRDNADKLVASLTKAGYPAWSTTAPPYRVYVGSYADKKNAAALAEKLKTERPADCGSAWTTSIAAPAIDKTIAGTDKAALEALATALQTVSEMAAKEAALWDARAKGTLQAAALKALNDAYGAKLSKAAADIRATSGGDQTLRDKTLGTVVAAQNNLGKVAALANGGTNAQYVDAATSLIQLSELYADAVVTLTPVGD